MHAAGRAGTGNHGTARKNEKKKHHNFEHRGHILDFSKDSVRATVDAKSDKKDNCH